MVHSDGIWNDLELQRKNWNQGQNGAFWWKLKLQWEKQYMFWLNQCDLVGVRYAKPLGDVEMDGDCCILPLFDTIFRPAEIMLKAMNLNGAFWRYLIRNVEMQRKIESNESKWCILPLFDTKFRPEEKMLKAMNLNGAFWRYLIRYFDLQRKKSKQRI